MISSMNLLLTRQGPRAMQRVCCGGLNKMLSYRGETARRSASFDNILKLILYGSA